jgi:hypothetical protein
MGAVISGRSSRHSTTPVSSRDRCSGPDSTWSRVIRPRQASGSPLAVSSSSLPRSIAFARLEPAWRGVVAPAAAALTLGTAILRAPAGAFGGQRWPLTHPRRSAVVADDGAKLAV